MRLSNLTGSIRRRSQMEPERKSSRLDPVGVAEWRAKPLVECREDIAQTVKLGLGPADSGFCWDGVDLGICVR
jgi:hypothetical protein